MNRWKRAAVIGALLTAVNAGTPVLASLNRGITDSQTAAINVTKHFPADMATGVAANTPLTVEFGGAVSQSFYQTINLSLFQGTSPIEGELFYNPSARQIMFKSKTPLEEGKTYTAQVSYFDGLGRTSEKLWSFQTSGKQAMNTPAAPQSAAPAQAASTSNNQQDFLNISNANMGSGFIKAETPMEISFSAPLDIASLKSAPIKLYQGQRAIGVDYKLSRDMKTVTVGAREDLKAGEAYTILVDKSIAGNTGANLRKNTLIPFKFGVKDDGINVAAHEINETPAPARRAAPVRSANHGLNNPFDNEIAQVKNFTPRNRMAPAQKPQALSSIPVQVTGLAPQNGARVTNLTQPITVGFSEEIRSETLNEFTFRLEDDFGPVPAKIHYFAGRKQATLTPIGMLDSNRTYRVVVTQGITDQTGKPIRTGISSTFLTVSPVASPAVPQMFASRPDVGAANYQNTPPINEARELESLEIESAQRRAPQAAQRQINQPIRRVASANSQRRIQNTQKSTPAPVAKLENFKIAAIYPGARASKVSRSSKIAVHFSEPADPSTVNNINISVFGNQRRVEGKVVYDQRKNRAVFEPSSPLSSNTEYKVIVSDKIKSRKGESLQKHSWQFATATDLRRKYQPRKTAEADAAFYIPLADGKARRNPAKTRSDNPGLKTSSGGGAFNFVDPKHWAFKSVRHISNKGILNSFPFLYTDSVTRYEFASVISSALSNIKSMQNSPARPELKIADLVQLESLIIEFRSELKSYGINPSWFEGFLKAQGVNLQQLELKVRKMK